MTDWREELARFVAEAPGNVIGPERALAPEWAGLRLYEEPLVGTADAGDPLFAALQAPEAVGPWFRVPGDWLPAPGRCCPFFCHSAGGCGSPTSPAGTRRAAGSTAGWRGRPF